MATLTTLVADPGALDNWPSWIVLPLTDFSFGGPIEGLSGPPSATSVSYSVWTKFGAAGIVPLGGVALTLHGTGLVYGNGNDGLPTGGMVTAITLSHYRWNLLDGTAYDVTPTHLITFSTPVSAAEIEAQFLDVSGLLFGGADMMVGASVGSDTLRGFAGNDTLDGQGGDDSLDGGADNDALNGGSGDDMLLGFSGNDTLDGQGDDDTLDGGADNDVLTGGAGDDLLIGGTGSDQLRLATGVDWAFGGDGNDVILVTDTGGNGFQPEADLLDGGTGTDILRISSATSSAVFLTGASITGIETLRVDAGYPWLTPAQFAAFTRIELGSPAGTLTTIGIKGNGTVNLNLAEMPLLASNGLSLLLSTDGTPGTAFSIEGRDLGTYVNDSIFGSMGNDSIRGNGGNDSLAGSVGNDTLSGGSGNDSLLGGDDNDTIWGSTGADTLEGGQGFDTLTGGDAADRFRFTGEDLAYQGQTDRITDFSRTQGDRIDLSGIDANAALAGDQAFSAPALLVSGAAPAPAGSLRYEVKRDHVLLSLYTDADAAADFFIRVNGTGWTPATSDFVL